MSFVFISPLRIPIPTVLFRLGSPNRLFLVLSIFLQTQPERSANQLTTSSLTADASYWVSFLRQFSVGTGVKGARVILNWKLLLRNVSESINTPAAFCYTIKLVMPAYTKICIRKQRRKRYRVGTIPFCIWRNKESVSKKSMSFVTRIPEEYVSLLKCILFFAERKQKIRALQSKNNRSVNLCSGSSLTCALWMPVLFRILHHHKRCFEHLIKLPVLLNWQKV